VFLNEYVGSKFKVFESNVLGEGIKAVLRRILVAKLTPYVTAP